MWLSLRYHQELPVLGLVIWDINVLVVGWVLQNFLIFYLIFFPVSRKIHRKVGKIK